MIKLTVFAVALVLLAREGRGQTEGGACTTTAREMIADPAGDCSKFFRCEEDKYMSYICTAGMVFDVDHCTWPEVSQSTCNRTTTSNMPLVSVDQTYCVYPCPETWSTVYPDWSDTSKMYVCKGGLLYQASCPDLGSRYLYFDPNFKSCDQIQAERNIHFAQFER